MNYRYPGPQSFAEEDEHIFFGRQRETKALYDLILVQPLVVLFARSGMGKTSLLQAGVLPRLRFTSYTPILLRLNELAVPIEEQALRRILPAPASGDTLWTAVARYNREWRETPLLIFDQFEEVFTLYTAEQRAAFVRQLADLISGSLPEDIRSRIRAGLADGSLDDAAIAALEQAPQAKIVLSIRSDFLYLLNRISGSIPSILRNRYELQALDEANTRLAITTPAGLPDEFASPGFSYSEAALQEIIDSLVASEEGGNTAPGAPREVEPFQAQLLCSYIEQKIIEEKHPAGFEVTPAFYGGRAGIVGVRKQYYEGVLAKFDAPTRTRVERLLGDFLLSNDRRIIQERDYLMEKCALDEQALALLCAERLLREEPRGGGFYYEISHDTLVAPIVEAREQRRKAEDAERQEQARLDAERREVLARAEAAKTRRQLRIVRILLAAALLALAAAGYFAWYSSIQKGIAEEKTEEAIAALDQARREEREKEEQRARAEMEKLRAEQQTELAQRSETEAQRQALLAQQQTQRARQEEYNRLLAEAKGYENKGECAQAVERYKLARAFANNTLYIDKAIENCINFEQRLREADGYAARESYKQAIKAYATIIQTGINRDLIRSKLKDVQTVLQKKANESQKAAEALSFDPQKAQPYKSQAEQYEQYIREIQNLLK